MPSSKEYLDYILDCLSHIDDISYRGMMGEYIIYFRQKVIGGIYDNRFLVKITDVTKDLIPNATIERPYDGAKPMILIEELEDREFLSRLFETMYPELPIPRTKKSNK